MYKFRSMVTNAEELKKKLAAETGQEDRFIFKMKDDPRITKVGHFIRKTSLDEFPQFYNVLKGDMSLVGPRPALPEEVARYGSLYSARLLVKPGITGPWQVSGRSDLSQEQSEYLDVSYIEEWAGAGGRAGALPRPWRGRWRRRSAWVARPDPGRSQTWNPCRRWKEVRNQSVRRKRPEEPQTAGSSARGRKSYDGNIPGT